GPGARRAGPGRGGAARRARSCRRVVARRRPRGRGAFRSVSSGALDVRAVARVAGAVLPAAPRRPRGGGAGRSARGCRARGAASSTRTARRPRRAAAASSAAAARRIFLAESEGDHGASSSDESAEGPAAHGLAWSPLLGRDIILDDEQATYVLVFTRAAEPGPGVVDRGATISRPLERARRIFRQQKDREIEGLGAGPVLAEEYHGVVRRKLEAVLERSGFTCACFPSVDGDETFLKLYLDPDGDVVRALAERFEYNVPLRRTCYGSTKRITNAEGSLCFAYTPFTADLYRRAKLQRLRRVDVIRIAHQHLSSIIDLEQLCKQGFISVHFAAATSEAYEWFCP
ncbi:unnamed protein product, partial [Prorocentrum cordatum]